jgi:serine/threonine protein phosphatase PrpC
MGGHRAGEVASSLALESIRAFLERATEDEDLTWPFGLEGTLDRTGNLLRTAVKLANRSVFAASERRSEYAGMGTTVAAVLVDRDHVVVCGVGDSRVYQIRAGAMERLTTDQTWVEALLAQSPGLERASFAGHPMRHVLTSVVGGQDEVEVTVTTHTLAPRERLVLCTDGVHGSLPDLRIADIARSAATVAEAADALVQAALQADGQDNLTALVVERVS